MNFEYMTDELFQEAVRLRRDFHRYPETRWQEYRTSSVLIHYLRELGYEVITGRDVTEAAARMGLPDDEKMKASMETAKSAGCDQSLLDELAGGFTGCIAILRGSRPGRVMACRFDIDALPVKESEKETHIPQSEGFRSEREGWMHACGHDGHMAAGLILAKLLMMHKEKVSGEIRLIFQPAEEGCSGAAAIVEKGWLSDVDLFLSGHIGIGARRLGQISICRDGFMATTKLDLEFKGKAAHAGNDPQNGANALLAAASFALNASAIARHGDGMTRVNIGTLHAGSGRNIIPDHAFIMAETRGATSVIDQYMTDRMLEIAKGAALMHQVDVRYTIQGRSDSASTDDTAADLIQKICDAMRVTDFVDHDTFLASEDAAVMMKHVQAHGGHAGYVMFGTPLGAGHHDPDFDFDEEVLRILPEFYARICFHASDDVRFS